MMPKATSQKRLNRDHARQQQRPMVEEEVIAAQLEALVTPAITAQENYYRQLGMRDRILNLPFMVAAVLTLLWRDVASVREMTRMLGREGFLWCLPTQVTQQAISQRFLTFPAELFERVFKELLPEFRKRWLGRTKRPLPDSIQFASGKFERIWACDGSTLEAIFRKLNSLEDVPIGKLAGKMGVVIDLITRLPVAIWFRENPKASDVNFESDILNIITSKTLILLDRGFYHFRFYAVLVDLGDAIADELALPFDRISLEMTYRGLYHFYVAHQKGLATNPVLYFAAKENQDLGIVKTVRKPNVKLIIAPFPESANRHIDFFFERSPQVRLTTVSQA
jgi:hypothetical protein